MSSNITEELLSILSEKEYKDGIPIEEVMELLGGIKGKLLKSNCIVKCNGNCGSCRIGRCTQDENGTTLCSHFCELLLVYNKVDKRERGII